MIIIRRIRIITMTLPWILVVVTFVHVRRGGVYPMCAALCDISA